MNGREIIAPAIQMSSTPNKGRTSTRLNGSCAGVSSGAGTDGLAGVWNCHGLEEVYRENAEPVPGPDDEFLGRPRGRARSLPTRRLILEGRPNLRNCIIHPLSRT